MNRFEELIGSVSTNLSVVVHLGAGSCQEYEVYKVLHAERVIFVEPNPILAEKAREQFSDSHDVTILECAISPNKGIQVLNITNNRRFSSLLKPADLVKCYPNIEILQEIEVETQTLESLCQQSKISDKTNNLLIAELQGIEGIVFSTTKADTLQKFNWIIIRASVNGQYHIETEDTEVDLLEKMKQAGFTVLTFCEDAPSFINILCIRNEAAFDNKKLLARTEDLSNTIRVIEHNFGKNITALDVLKNTSKKKILKLKKSIKARTKKYKNQTQSLVSKTEAQQQKITELTKLLGAKVETLSQARDQIQSLVSETEAQQQKITELTELHDASVEALSQAQDRNKLTASEAENLQKQVNTLINSANDKQNEIQEIQQSMRINNKLMLKSDNDMGELQLQYRAAMQRQEQQNTLLSELKEKLRQASAFYQKLNLQNLVLDNDMLGENDPPSIESNCDENNP